MRLKMVQIASLVTTPILIFGFQNCAKLGTNGISVESVAASDSVVTAPGASSDGTVAMKQNFTVGSNSKIDILFVIDNSGSMEYEQQNMAARMSDFISIVSDLDYRIAVTTTDPSNQTYGDGNLVTMKGLTDTYILDSSMDPASAQNILGATVQRSERGSGSEQGIYASRRAVERSIASVDSKKQFIRSDAALAVVLISDEDESASAPKNIPENLISYIDAQYSNLKSFTFNSIITRPGDTACIHGNGKTPGVQYQKLSNLTGGFVGSVCEADYSSQMTSIANEIKKNAKSFTLSCAPVDTVNSPVTVMQNNQPVTDFVISGRNLQFSSDLAAGNYEVSYACAE